MKKDYKLSRTEQISSESPMPETIIPIRTKEQHDLLESFLKDFSLELGDLKKISFMVEAGIFIPVSIFRDLSPLESLVLYLTEQGMRLSEIARHLNRDQRTIWITLRNAKRKNLQLDLKSSYYVPLQIFSDRKLSILEHLCVNLKNQGLKLKEIAALLHKAPNTIWTCYARAKKKGEAHGG